MSLHLICNELKEHWSSNMQVSCAYFIISVTLLEGIIFSASYCMFQ